MVEHVAKTAQQQLAIEGLGAAERHFLADREQQLEPDLWRIRRAGHAPGKLEHHRDRGLVVSAEDRSVRVLPSAVNQRRLHRRFERHRVEMGAQQNALGTATGDAGKQISCVGADLRAGAVLLGSDPHPIELADNPVSALALVPRGALDPAQRLERLSQLLAFGLGAASHEATAGETVAVAFVLEASRSIARSSAAPTNASNSGAGRSSRDIDS